MADNNSAQQQTQAKATSVPSEPAPQAAMMSAPAQQTQAIRPPPGRADEHNSIAVFAPTADDVQTDDAPIRKIGYTIIFVVFVMFGGWSMLAPIDSAVLASGTLKVKSSRKTVQHLEGGIVNEIRVRDGDHVEAGEVLLVIDQTQARAELALLKGQFITAQGVAARLIAERDGLTEVDYPYSDLVDERVLQVIASENQQFLVRRQSRSGEVEVFEQRGEQLRNQIKGLEELIISKKELLTSYNEEISDNQALLKDGFVDKQRLRNVQRSKTQLQGEIAEYRSKIDGINVQITEVNLQVLQLNKKFKTEVVNQFTDIEGKVFDLTERTSAMAERVRRSEVLAPTAGMVLGLSVHTEGGVIAPGTPILDIVPDGEELIVEAELQTVDIDRVSLGMLSDLRFSAFKSGSTPVIKGKVIKLSADSLINQTTGMPYYLVRLSVSEEGMESLGGQELLPGMPAEVLINTGSRTLFQYLMQPATDAVARSMIEE